MKKYSKSFIAFVSITWISSFIAGYNNPYWLIPAVVCGFLAFYSQILYDKRQIR